MATSTTPLQRLADTVGLPLRLLLPHETVNRLGLTSLRDERYARAQAHCRGRLLDIGCGNNQLIRNYGHDSVGVDVFDFGGGAMIVKDTAQLPFRDAEFDSATFIASINHIPNRQAVLKETARVLRPTGRIIATMLWPTIGLIRHKLAWWDEDQRDRGMIEGELTGMSESAIIDLLANIGFRLAHRESFICGMNHLYVFERSTAPTTNA